MDLTSVSERLQEIIINDGELHIPGVGAFVVESMPAAFLDDGKTMVPPSKQLKFSYGNEVADGEESLVELSGAILASISAGENFTVPGFGVFEPNGNGISFTADEAFDFAPDNFSLEAISLEVNEEPEKRPEQVVQPKPEVKVAEEKPQKRGLPKWVWGVIIAILLFVLLLLLAVIFKDDLRPLLQDILYSKEELEIMQKWAAQ